VVKGPKAYEGRFGQKTRPRFTAAVGFEAPPASDQDVCADQRVAHCSMRFESLSGNAVDSEEMP
jgi:hypothetical protein